MEPTVCEIFAGIGGFRYGLEKAGPYRTAWMNQWEPSRKRQDAYVSNGASSMPLTTALSNDATARFSLPSMRAPAMPKIFRMPQASCRTVSFPVRSLSGHLPQKLFAPAWCRIS